MALYRVLESETAPTASVNDASPITLGVYFTVSESCTLNEVHFFQPSTGTISTADRSFGLYTTVDGNTGTLVPDSTGTITPTTSGWQTATLGSPVTLSSGVLYVLAVYYPEGQYVATPSFFTSTAYTSGPVSFLSSPESPKSNMVFNTSSGGALAFPKDAFNQSCYWLDVTIETGTVGPDPLTINVGADSATYVGTASPTLTGVASGGEGTKTYAWTIQSGPTGTFSAATSASTTFTPTTAGTSVLRCTVTDTSGSAFDELNMVVSEVPTDIRLFGTSTPPTVSDDSSGIVVGVEFKVTSAADLTTIMYYQPSSGTVSTAQRDIALYEVASDSAGTSLYTGTLTPVGSGWQSHGLTTPVTLDPTKSYRAAVFHPAGGYVATGGYFTTGPGSSGISVGVLTAPSSAAAFGTDQGSFLVGSAMAYPTDGFNGGNYWVDVIVVQEPAIHSKMAAHNGTSWVIGKGWAHNGTSWVQVSVSA